MEFYSAITNTALVIAISAVVFAWRPLQMPAILARFVSVYRSGQYSAKTCPER